METPKIERVEPWVVLAGGLVRVSVTGFDAGRGIEVFFDGQPAQVVGASSRSILARAPLVEGPCEVTLRAVEATDKEKRESADPRSGPPDTATVYAAEMIADEVNPVCNPAVDSNGNIYVTFSGQRGATVPFSIYRVPFGSREKEPFLTDIVNATGIVVGPDDTLYISSRHTGAIYRCDLNKNMERFAENLGIASGLALDRKGHLYVGDRGGTIHKLDPSGHDEILCEIEPSVSAFHLAMRDDQTLFVSGPTLATQDNIYEIGEDRTPKVFFHGIGRPQGMTFDRSGRLLATGSYKGRRGVFAIDPAGRVQQLVASPMLVGVLISPKGDLILADSDSLYRVPSGSW